MASKTVIRASMPGTILALVFSGIVMFAATLVAAGEAGTGEWQTINTEFGESRHEGAAAQAGELFYVLGGRESNAVRIYDPFDGENGSWSSGATSPIQLHHFQAVELDGLIYAIGAMTGPYPEEPPVENVYIYDPLADAWTIGPALPPDRLRGSSGTVVHDGMIYWISGNTLGHVGPVTDLVDVYDPATGHFTALAEIPNPRDHFFATVHQGSIYVIGGRRSVPEGGAFEPTIPEIDVYDIAADSWQTLPPDTHLNPPRAAAATDRIGDEIIIAGGESGALEPMAHTEAQAFDPATGQWRDLADMLTPRHAAQAIVSNDGFYLASGSPFRGGPGGAVLDTEALFLAGTTTPTGTPITAGTISAPATIEFDAATGIVPISHEGGNQAVIITAMQISGSAAFSLVEPLPGPVSLAPGAGRDIAVNYTGGFEAETATLAITDSNDQVTTITLEAEGGGEPMPPIAFTSQTITARQLPTQLEFGPDERLYVTELDGLIYAYTIERDDATGVYSIIETEVIDLIQTIPNHNDDGTPYSGEFSDLRNVTGMITAGTADNPVLFVTSSDPRIDDPQADTNSGTLSRLTWTGSEWIKLDLVRSLPRSEHDHLPNGMALDAGNGILYLAQGGHTNMGAPSFSFGYLPEYALSAAILSIDLDAIGEQTYDIPTLKGEVFGGQLGDNQAMIVPGGPVQVHSPGYRNAYDVLLTAAGRLYTFDNDSNAGWGGLPIGEGPGGNCTNQSNESDSATHHDNFHLITGPGYYGGHPNPTRANRSNTFDGLSPIPEGFENPVECQFLIPGVEDGAIALYDASTNGLAEYTATNFDGQMSGNIIATAWDGKVLRLSLNSSGDEVIEQNDLFTGLSGPLGVTAQGDAGPFPGTIWIAQFFNGQITVFEPDDFSECDPDTLDPNDTSPNGYTYGDLIDNGLDPCNPSQVPPDFDLDFVSDLNDPDIDGDGIANVDDLFDFDADNGRGTPLPHRLSWSSDVIGTLGGMIAHNAPGFTGLMAHPVSPISVFDQFDPDDLIPGGAAGIFTVEAVTPGDAQLNTQENAFHFGVDVHGGSPAFTARTRIMAPFAGAAPQDNQSMGLLIGRGDQDNYIKLVTNANAGDGGIQFAAEIQGDFSSQQLNAAILGADYVDLYLVIDPAGLSAQASYVITVNGVRGPRTGAGQPIDLPASWLNDPTNGPAIGIISTSSGAGPFSASWGFVEAYEGTGEHFPVPDEGQLDADPPILVFPETPVGDTSIQTVTLGNFGESVLVISESLVTGDNVFVADLALPQTLEPGATHDFSVSFTPDAANGFEAALILSHDGGNSPLQIAMTGDGVPAPGEGQLDADPPALTFPNTLVGDTATQTVTLSNSGDATLDITDAALTGDNVFVADLALPQTLEPGATHDFSVSFTPDAATGFEAALTLSHDGGNSPLQIAMTGEGAELGSVLVPVPGQVDFGGVMVGSESEPQSISLTNEGQATVTIGALEIGGEQAGDFSLDAAMDSCSSVALTPGQECSFAVRFQPTLAGGRSAQVDVPSDAEDLTVTLQGRGLGALDLDISVAPNPAIAGNPLTYTLVVNNLTNAPAENVALEFSLPPATDLQTTDGCEQDPAGHPVCTIGPIPANGSHQVVVSVEVASNAAQSLQFEASVSADSLDETVVEMVTTPLAFVTDLSLVMTGDAVPVDAQTMAITYVIVVSNAGPSDADSAMVMSEWAPGLEDIEWTCEADATASCTSAGQDEIDDLADLPAGTSVIYVVEAMATHTLVEQGFTSSAEVAPTGEATDPNLDNNSASVTIAHRLFHDRFETVKE